MGLMSKLLGVNEVAEGIGGAVETVAEVFTINKTKAELAVQAQATVALGQFGEEFSNAKGGWFNSFINGLNRLPRPIMALGTVGLFVFSMASPDAFAIRMQGLNYVPDPLWWLLGAVVSFYFGARELHYARRGNLPKVVMSNESTPSKEPYTQPMRFPDNAALSEWAALQN